jgi:hypothetical protein
MIAYHENEKTSMKIFPSQAKAKEFCSQDEISIPYGSPYGEQRWVRMPKAEYIRFRYSARFAH